MKKVTVCVIGAGSGGIAFSNRAALLGASVALIDAHNLGGTCVNVGCVPKKVMWLASELSDHLAHASDFGFSVSSSFHWEKLIDARQAYIKRIHESYERVLSSNKVERIIGRAQILDKNTVRVENTVIQCEHLVIATGGQPTRPSIEGAHLGWTSDDFFSLHRPPKKVAVVGAGYIAVELAGVLNKLGVETHLAMRRHCPLRNFDEMLSDTLNEYLVADGIQVHHGFDPKCVLGKPGHLTLVAQNDEKIEDVDGVIWAIGRHPNTENLNLESLGIQLTQSGHIKIDDFQNTSIAGIYALGDVTPQLALTPVAVAAGRRLAHRLFDNDPESQLPHTLVPTVIFSHPPIGTIGLSEEQAKQTYGEPNIKVYATHFVSMNEALGARRQQTKIKLIVAGPNEAVVGLHLIGPHADEILQGFAVAINMGATKADFDRTIAIHPTSAEELVTLK